MHKIILSKPAFYVLSFTWGLPMTLIGCLASLVLLVAGYKPKRNQYAWYFEIGENWGGCDLGCMSLIQKPTTTYLQNHLKNHEFGHAIQNCWFGPFMIVVSIWSAARYWYREYLTRCRKKSYDDLPSYDAIWFEGQASYLGVLYEARHYFK